MIILKTRNIVLTENLNFYAYDINQASNHNSWDHSKAPQQKTIY